MNDSTDTTPEKDREPVNGSNEQAAERLALDANRALAMIEAALGGGL